MKLIHHKEVSSWLSLMVICSFLLLSCEKERVEVPVVYEEFSSVVGSEARTLKFFSYSSGIPDEMLPWIDIPAGCFDGETRILLDYKRLSSDFLPESLAAVSSETDYIWFFDSESLDPLKDVSITIPYPENLDEKILGPYEDRFRLYRAKKNTGTGFFGNLEPVEDYTLDIAANQCFVTAPDFSYGYTILFPEIYRNDHIIINAKDTILFWYRNNEILQHHHIDTLTYFSVEQPGLMGFHVRNDSSHYFLLSPFGEDLVELHFSFPGTSPGIYTGHQIKVEYSTYFVLGSLMFELYHFVGTSDTRLEIKELGEIGEMVSGTLTGELYETTFPGIVEFYIHFEVKRMR